MSCSRWLSTLFEATAHRAVMRKELSEVECHALQHHEVVVDIHRSPRTARMVRMVSVPAHASTSRARRGASPLLTLKILETDGGGVCTALTDRRPSYPVSDDYFSSLAAGSCIARRIPSTGPHHLAAWGLRECGYLASRVGGFIKGRNQNTHRHIISSWGERSVTDFLSSLRG